jgi:hypothetical protein
MARARVTMPGRKDIDRINRIDRIKGKIEEDEDVTCCNLPGSF